MKPLLLLLLTVFFQLSGCAQNQPPSSVEQPTTLQDTADSEPVESNEPVELECPVPYYSNIWDRVLAFYQLDIDHQDRSVDAQLNWYRKHQSYILRVGERAKRYLYFIMEQIEIRQMPGELALLPIVESAFEPFAYSHGRAAGVWQFIPSTGRIFGLKQDWWQDGRRDIRASTNAALDYLASLNRQFKGDWLLALAAYNSGAGTVRKAIRKNRKKGLGTDFWSLKLPKETEAYVPKLVALARLLKYQEDYGISWTEIPNQPYFSVVETGGQIDLSQLAELSDTPLDEIYHLNPGFNRWATHPNGPHEALIPIEKKPLYLERLPQLPANERVKWQRYTIRSGDSLIKIAKRFHTTPAALKQANGLTSNRIRARQVLLIPSAIAKYSTYAHSQKERMKRLKTARRPDKHHRSEYRVQQGDSLWSIARKFGTSSKTLARWNGMAPKDPIISGQKLLVWQKSKRGAREVIRKVRYNVRSGDSLARIADKFDVKIKDIRRWNTRSTNRKYLKPGQILTLYVDVTR